MANVPHTANNNNRTSSFSVPSSRAPLAPSVSQPRLHASGRGAAANNAAIKPSASAAKQPAKSWTEAPSARIKAIKCADPFASKASAFKTRFGSVFHAGEVPCRLHHGAVNVKLHWTRDPSTLNYDPLLVTCAEVGPSSVECFQLRGVPCPRFGNKPKPRQTHAQTRESTHTF